MLIGIFKNSFRIFWYHRFHSAINVLGLSVGIASCLLIYLFVQNEWAYDKHHSKHNRIYRLVSDLSLGGEEGKHGLSSYMLSPTLKQDYPEVEESIRVMPVNKQTMWVNEKPFQFNDNLMSEAGFFSMFDYVFIEGDPKTALIEPQSVVITDEVAMKMFGATTGILGKMIKYARQSYKVTGVVKDVKDNSHLYFNTLLSLNSIPEQLENTLRNDWFYLAQTNYVLFKNESDAIGFDHKLVQLRDKYIMPWTKQVNTDGKITHHLQPLTDIHLSSDYPAGYAKVGNKSYTYIFSLLAIFILIIASINYVNMATAASAKRAKEIGIRKTLGADARTLFIQFIVESLLIALFATILGLLWAHLVLPTFNNITNKFLTLDYTLGRLLILPLFALLIGVIAGIYPALYLSRLQPAIMLKSGKVPGGFISWMRKSLLTLQFTIALLFAACTAVVYSQITFIKNKNMGFNKDQILIVSMPAPDTAFTNKFEVVKQELLRFPSIQQIALTSNVPGMPTGNLFHVIETADHQRQEKAIDYLVVSHDFIPILNIQLAQGRNFNKDFLSDQTGAFIVNEKAVKTYGWKDPLNCTLENGFGYKGKIIGVVKDFNYKSLHENIQPMIMMLGKQIQGNLMLKIAAGKEAESIEHLEKLWSQYSRKYPLEYFFLDDNFNKLYKNDIQVMQLFTLFSLISLLLCSVGLYAMVTHHLEQRVKEIGIRKVMGASVFDIVMMMNKEYLLLFVFATIIAISTSVYLMQQWLENFAYRVALTPWVFIASTALIACIALLTISLKTFKAASANPVDSLRYE